MAIIAMALLASPVSAFELTDCRLIVQSSDADGEPLDTAVGDTDGGEGGTRDDPFRVDYDGTVRYEGDTGEQLITDQTWSVDVFLIPTPLRGGGPNEEEQASAEGEVDVSDSLPIRVNGLFFVSGQVSGEGGACRGSAWVRMLGDSQSTVTTVPFWIALLVIAVGLIVLWQARPGVAVPVQEVR
ncbi:MAG: hypothetical protein ACRDGB_10300 [Candidatus Limnocylindria bacterium]